MTHRRKVLALLLTGCISTHASATAQIPEELLFDGRREMLFSEPLNRYLQQSSNLAKLQPHLSKNRCTGSWRDYRGTWEIRDSRLYLTRLVTDPCSASPKEIPLAEVFMPEAGPIFAEWYTGELIVPTGKQVQYVHMGYESQYERYIVFTVFKGKVIGQRESVARPR